jgi:hypothetical protein
MSSPSKTKATRDGHFRPGHGPGPPRWEASTLERAIRTELLRGPGIDSQPGVIDSLDSIPVAEVLDEPY